MPIGFADLLQTNAQYVNGLNKGIVSTDDVYGGLRSKIDDWTDLHLSTKTNDNNVTYYTFQDDGTGAAPGQFKAYSTMFYVADGRALVEDSGAAANFIRLDASGNYVSSGGTKYVVPSSGTAEPEYWVLSDPTEIGGTGTGTDKLPTFTITGTQGSNSTAIPAGYSKLQVLTNAAADPGGSGYNSTIGVDTDLDTSGAQVIDTISLTDGVVVSDITTRTLLLSDLGYTGDTDANNYSHPTQTAITIDSDTGALTNATVISDIDIDFTIDTLGHVTAATYTTATRDLTLANLGYTGAADANNYSHPNHTGDVTSTGDGATVIADEAVTLAKMAHIATASFLGRNTAATGDVEVLNMTTAKSMLSVDDLVTLSGVSDGDTNLGTFSGSTIGDNLTIKAALQALETQVDSNSNNSGTTNLSVGTTNATTLILSSSTQDNSGVTIPVHADGVAGIITDAAQTIHGNKTFNDNVTITGNLTVTDSTSYVNIQEENVYIKDALITLGITDADTSTVDGTAASSDVGIEAYKQNHDGSAHPTLTFNITDNYWTVHNKDHAASTQNKIAEKFTATVTAAATNAITHNLNTRDVIVQCRIASTEEIVLVKYICNTDQQTTIYFGAGTVGTSVDVVIIG